jgi:hypothetical protein
MDCTSVLDRSRLGPLGNANRQTVGRGLNKRVENSQQPFRRRERAMAKFQSAKSLHKFTAIHASGHNHFDKERHLHSRESFKLNCIARLAEWRHLAARYFLYKGIFWHENLAPVAFGQHSICL